MSPSQSILTWSLGLLIGLTLLWTSPRHNYEKVLSTLLLGLTCVNGALIFLVSGIGSYSSHKWMAVFIPVFGSMLVAALTVRIGSDRTVAGRWILGVLTVTAVVIAFSTTARIPFVVPRDLVLLADNPVLRNIDLINIDLGNYYEDAYAATLLPTRTVVLGETYARPGKPLGKYLLVRTESGIEADERRIQLNKTYALVQRD